VVRVKT